MTSYTWLSIISLLAWLVLAISGLRARNLDTRKTLLMAAAWSAIFLIVTAFIVAIGR